MGDLRVDAGYQNGFMTEDRRWEMPLWPQFKPSNPDPSSIGGESWAVAEETIQEMLCCIHPTLDSEEKRKDVIEYVQKLIRTSIGCEKFFHSFSPWVSNLPSVLLEKKITFANLAACLINSHEKAEPPTSRTKTVLFDGLIVEHYGRIMGGRRALLSPEFSLESNCNEGCEQSTVVVVFPYGSVPLKTYLPDGDIDLTALSSQTVEGNLAHNVLALLQAEEKKEDTEYEVKDTQFIDAEVKLVKCLVQDIVIDISFNQLGGLCSLCFLEQIDRIVGKDHLFKRSIILIKAWCYYESRILGAHHGLISTYALETLVLYIFHLFHLSLNGPVAVLYRFLDYFSKFDWDNYCISLKGPVPKSSIPDIVVQMPPNPKGNFLLTEEFLRNCLDMFSVPSKGPEADKRTFPLKHLNIIDPLKENNNLGRSVHRGNYYRIRSALNYGARKLGRILQLPEEGIADEMKRFFSNTIERHGGSKGANVSSFQSRALSEESPQVNSWTSDLENFLPGMGYNGGVDAYLFGLVSEKTCSMDVSGVSGCHLAGEASMNDSPYCSSSSSAGDLSQSLSRLNFYATPYHYSGSSTENGRLQNSVSPYTEKPAKLVDENVGSSSDKYFLGLENGASSCISSEYDGGSSYSCCYSTISSPYASTLSEGLSLDFRESDIIAGSPETLDPLSELTGDYDSHIRSLLYGQCCNGYALSAAAALTTPPSNGTMDHSASSTCGSNEEGKHNQRGTDLYFPNANGCSVERSSSNQARAGQQRSSSRNGSVPVLSENSHNKGRNYSQCQAALSNGGLLETNHVAGSDTHSRINGFSVPSSSSSQTTKLEFGSVGCVVSEECVQPGLDAYCGQGSTLKFKNSSRIGSK